MEIGLLDDGMMVVIFVCLLFMTGGIRLFSKNVIRNQAMKIQEQEVIISHQVKIIKRLMPENPCQILLTGFEINCMRPSSYVYAGVQVCEECAQKLIDRGANPPPVRFDFGRQQACTEIA